MFFVGGAAGDPLFEEVALGGGEGFFEFRWGHHVVGVLGAEAADDFASFGVAGVDGGLAGFAAAEGGVAVVEAELALAALVVGAVAFEAAVREEGADVSAKAQLGGGAEEGGASGEAGEEGEQREFHQRGGKTERGRDQAGLGEGATRTMRGSRAWK